MARVSARVCGLLSGPLLVGSCRFLELEGALLTNGASDACGVWAGHRLGCPGGMSRNVSIHAWWSGLGSRLVVGSDGHPRAYVLPLLWPSAVKPPAC